MNFLENLLKPKIDTVELASQLFETQMVGGTIDRKYQYKVNKILKECTPEGEKYPERQQVLLKVIELIGEPKTPKERFLVAKAYAWSRANYRQQAIKYLELYLNNELYSEIIKTYSSNWSYQEGLKHHLSEMYGYLGKAYIGEYNFDKALSIYEYMINKFPDDPPSYMGKCEVLTKQNKLEECHDWLVSCKELPYYKLNEKYGKTEDENWFYFTINRLLNDTKEKIKKGYKYRPRKNK